MSQENVELTRRAFEAFKERDLDGLLAMLDDDVEAFPRLAAVEGGYRGSRSRGAAGVGDVYNSEYGSSRVGTGGAEVTYACYRRDGLSELRRSRGGSHSLPRAVRDALCLRGHPPGRTRGSAFRAEWIGIVGSARAQRPGTGRRRDPDPVNGATRPCPDDAGRRWFAAGRVSDGTRTHDRLDQQPDGRGGGGFAPRLVTRFHVLSVALSFAQFCPSNCPP
jgi:hypothetical protein